MADCPRHDHASTGKERETMSKHKEVLERDLSLYQARCTERIKWADDAKRDGDLTRASVFTNEANEAHERADAIRHALDVMAKAEALPKTADGVTVWPSDRLCGFNESGPFEHETHGFFVPWSGRFYSTPQAAKDAAKDAK
jgi:hypothetical protein